MTEEEVEKKNHLFNQAVNLFPMKNVTSPTDSYFIPQTRLCDVVPKISTLLARTIGRRLTSWHFNLPRQSGKWNDAFRVKIVKFHGSSVMIVLGLRSTLLINICLTAVLKDALSFFFLLNFSRWSEACESAIGSLSSSSLVVSCLVFRLWSQPRCLAHHLGLRLRLKRTRFIV